MPLRRVVARIAPLVVIAIAALSSSTGCAEPALAWRTPAVPAAVALASTDCVDIRSTLADDEHIPASSALIWFEFENRCDEAVAIDWSAVSVTGFVANAENNNAASVPLALHNASHHVVPGRLDGKWNGSEALRFDAADKEAKLVDRICIDLTRVARPRSLQAGEGDGDSSSREQRLSPPAIVCVSKPGDPSIVDMSRSGFREAHEPQGHGTDYRGSSFGMNWNTAGWPRFVFDTGFSMHSTNLRGVALSAPNDAKRIDGAQIGDGVTSGMWDLRLRGFVHGPFYVGTDLGVGFGGSRKAVLQGEGGDPVSLSGSPSGHIAMGGMIGIAGRVGRLQPFAEVGGGMRGMIFSLATPSGHDVMDDGSQCNCPSKVSAWWATVTPRAGVDLWILPNVTLGGYASIDALHSQNKSAGLLLGIHTRAFDGR